MQDVKGIYSLKGKMVTFECPPLWARLQLYASTSMRKTHHILSLADSPVMGSIASEMEQDPVGSSQAQILSVSHPSRGQ